MFCHLVSALLNNGSLHLARAWKLVFSCGMCSIQGREGSTLQDAGPFSTPTYFIHIAYIIRKYLFSFILDWVSWWGAQPIIFIKCLIKQSSVLLLPSPDRKQILSWVVMISAEVKVGLILYLLGYLKEGWARGKSMPWESAQYPCLHWCIKGILYLLRVSVRNWILNCCSSDFLLRELTALCLAQSAYRQPVIAVYWNLAAWPLHTLLHGTLFTLDGAQR